MEWLENVDVFIVEYILNTVSQRTCIILYILGKKEWKCTARSTMEWILGKGDWRLFCALNLIIKEIIVKFL